MWSDRDRLPQPVNDDLVLRFDDASLVRVSLRSEDYVGPEAFCLAVPGGSTIVA
jgi:hypothetical protein